MKTTPLNVADVRLITAFAKEFFETEGTMVDSSTFEFDDLVIEKVIGTRTRKTIGGPEEYEANFYQFHVPVYYAGGLHEPPDVDMALHSTREYLRDILQDVLCYASSDKLIGWWENQQANWNTEEAQP